MTDRVLINRGDLKRSLKTGRRKGCCCLGGCVGLIVLVVLMVMALAASKDALVGGLARHFPQEWEQRVGDALVAATVPEGSRITDPALRAGIEEIARPIFAAIPKDEGFTSFTLHLSSDKEPNAYAIPGGHIVVNVGLITLADSPEEVAGVLAHEAAHATLRHGLQSLISRAGTAAVMNMVLGDLEGMTGILVEGSGYLLNQKYSRDFERQADEKAWEYLTKANVNPAGLTTFFEKLEGLQGSATPPAILSTHPATKERIDALNARQEALPDGKVWYKYALDYGEYKVLVTGPKGPK